MSPPEYDTKHPFKIGEEYYPDASKRANEEGRCILMDATAQTSTGFPRLDEVCAKGIKEK